MPLLIVPGLLLLLASLAPAQPQSPGGEPRMLARVGAPVPSALRAALDAQGYDVSCLGLGPDYVEAVLSDAEHRALVAAGFAVTVVALSEPFADIAARDIPAGYRDLAAITALLAQAETTHPGLARVVDVAQAYGPGATVEGRPILAVKLSDNVLADEPEPNVLIASCHHCREIVTPEIALDILARLLSGYGVDPQITAFLDDNEVWIVPVQNPDGLEYVWTTNNLWRKNRRPNPGGTYGVDLNRNYPLGWSAPCSGSTSPGNDTYKGPAPASEPETQTMIAFARDRRFAKVLDFHSHGREVLQSYLCTPMPAAIQGFIDSEAVLLAQAASYGVRDPSADGQHQEWEIAENTSYSFLVETEAEFQPPFANAVLEAARLWPLVTAFLARPIPLRGRVLDAFTLAPLEADITVAGIAWSNGETRRSRPRDGLYHLFLDPGTYSVHVSAPGYQGQTLITALGAGSLVQDVHLVPLAPPFTLDFSTSGGGAGNLHLGLLAIPASTHTGFTVFSFFAPGPVGQGNLGGLYADILSFQILTSPLAPGSIFHWTWPAPGIYPAVPVDLPPGSLPLPAGFAVDGVGVALSSANALLGLTPVVRAVF